MRFTVKRIFRRFFLEYMGINGYTQVQINNKHCQISVQKWALFCRPIRRKKMKTILLWEVFEDIANIRLLGPSPDCYRVESTKREVQK